MANFDLYLKNDMAFVKLNSKYMVCLGTKEAVENATDDQIVELVFQALAMVAFNAISKTGKRTVQ